MTTTVTAYECDRCNKTNILNAVCPECGSGRTTLVRTLHVVRGGRTDRRHQMAWRGPGGPKLRLIETAKTHSNRGYYITRGDNE